MMCSEAVHESDRTWISNGVRIIGSSGHTHRQTDKTDRKRENYNEFLHTATVSNEEVSDMKYLGQLPQSQPWQPDANSG